MHFDAWDGGSEKHEPLKQQILKEFYLIEFVSKIVHPIQTLCFMV